MKFGVKDESAYQITEPNKLSKYNLIDVVQAVNETIEVDIDPEAEQHDKESPVQNLHWLLVIL